jgi:hypothetical protein
LNQYAIWLKPASQDFKRRNNPSIAVGGIACKLGFISEGGKN